LISGGGLLLVEIWRDIEWVADCCRDYLTLTTYNMDKQGLFDNEKLRVARSEITAVT
jgi:hypothetical protein